MPHYLIVPTDHSYASSQVVAPDGGTVLNTVVRLGCGEADVLADGLYAFSVRHGDNGLWTIFQRIEDVAPKSIPAFG